MGLLGGELLSAFFGVPDPSELAMILIIKLVIASTESNENMALYLRSWNVDIDWNTCSVFEGSNSVFTTGACVRR